MSSPRCLLGSPRRRTRWFVWVALVVSSGALACSKRAASDSEAAPLVSAPPMDDTAPVMDPGAAHAPALPATEENAAELSARAEARLAELAPNDKAALIALLDDPNRYLRAGALDRLRDRPAALSGDALERTVELLNDPAPLTSRACPQAESSAPGRGSTYLAADCSGNPPRRVADHAHDALLRVKPGALAAACVRVFARTPYLAEPLEALVTARRAELARPLQQALVRAERAGRLGEVDAALQLLAHLELGAGEPAAVQVLQRLAKQHRPLHALRAKVRLLALTHDAAIRRLPAWAESTYDELRALLQRDPKRPCALDQGCIPIANALVELRPLREAAAPLVPELTRLLDSDDAWLRDSSLRLLEKLGEKARPAVPKVVALLGRSRPETEEPKDIDVLLDVLAAARQPSSNVRRAVVATVRRHPTFLGSAVAALVRLGLRPTGSERAPFQSAFAQTCTGANSVASDGAPRDDRCDKLAADLKKLGVRVASLP